MDKEFKDAFEIFLLVGILLTCLFVAHRVITHYEIYNNDPLVYGAIQHDLERCMCVKGDNEIFFDDEKVWYIKQMEGTHEVVKINYTQLDELIN